jgi:putative tryptophan/tyrosine transport system substrate-binding protein
MKRREFMILFGGAVASWPLPAHAQQPAMPMIGYLGARSIETDAHLVVAFLQGLKETGYVEGENIRIVYRWADGRYELLSPMATDLVRRRVAVIVTSGGSAVALAAKAATLTIPIVFSMGGDPVKAGLVASMNRPGGNATGLSALTTLLSAKRVELLHELVPKAIAIASLVNPSSSDAPFQQQEMRVATEALGLRLDILRASTESGIDSAFATLAELRSDALVVATDPLFNNYREKIITLAKRDAVPAIYDYREHTIAGGLISYGTNLAEVYRKLGSLYIGKILAGARPADLPVEQSTTIELLINLKTAKTLGLTVPRTLLARADEVIE